MSDPGTLVAGVLTLAIFTFLYRDNPLYRMAESLLIGVSVGYVLVVVWSNTLMQTLFVPISSGKYALVVPLVLGLLMFGRLHSRTSFLSRFPIAVMIGSGAGVAVPAMLEQRTLKQLSDTVAPLLDASGLPSVSSLVVLVGMLTTLSYFYFSRERKGPLGVAAGIGTYFLMIFFGATFGYTVMSRMSVFIGRMEFLLTDFLHLTG